MQLDLVVVGNLAVDDVVYDTGRTRMGQAGGATLYVALGARLWKLTVGMVARAGQDYPENTLEALVARGIELDGVRPMRGPGLRSWLLYEGGLRRLLHRLDGPTHEEASPTAAEIPASWRARAIHLAPMPFALQLELASSLADAAPRPALLALDPYELLSTDRVDRWRPLLSNVDILFLGEDEVASASARRAPRALLPRLATPRLRHIFYKRGERGGLAYSTRPAGFHEWRPRTVAVRDLTGAGDAFAGGVLAGMLLGDCLRGALERGVVAASFAIEGRGAEALMAASPSAATNRLRSWFRR